MITVTVKNIHSQLSSCPTELERILTAPYENYFFSPRYKSGLWDGKYHFLKPANLTFPTGLLFVVEEYFTKNNIEYTISDQRIPPMYYVSEQWLVEPGIESKILCGIEMRDYQIEAIARSLLSERGVFELPTGSGKTEIAAGIIKVRDVYPVLFIVHTQDLLWQTVDRFKKRLNRDIGYIGDGEKNLDPDIIVATVQSLDAWLKRDSGPAMQFLYSIKMLFLDECHHASAETWFKVGLHTINAYYRYGLSGTILRRDVLSNMKLLALFGEPIMRLSAADLMRSGYLSEISVTMVDNPEKLSGTTWQAVYSAGVVRSVERNEKIVRLAREEYKNNRRILILVRQIEHGHILKKMLNDMFIPAVFLRGDSTSDLRQEMKEKFNNDGGFILIASTIFDEGVDLPEINVLIIAAGGKSEVKTIQRIGRGLRKKADKSKLKVYDFMDGSKFLKTHSKKRLSVYRQEEFISTEGVSNV